MNVIEKINSSKSPLFTFELLPPLKGRSIVRIYNAIEKLLDFEPAYINFTSHRNEVVYNENADGSVTKNIIRKRPGTIALAAAVKYKYNITVVPHVICSGFTKEETENALIEMDFLGITDVLALRGDPPKGFRRFEPEKGGHRHTSELVEQIVNMNKAIYLDKALKNTKSSNFCIGVAGYPEKHFEAPNMEEDLRNLKLKVDNGASYIVTQMFFNNQVFFKFCERCREIGITVPIVPGIKPISAMSDIDLLPQTFSIDLPSDLYNAVKKCKTDQEAREIGIEWCIAQTKDLLAHNVPGVHYYTLSDTENIARIVKASF